MAENLTKAAFIEKVFDFENEKEWKFKGDVPCIIDFYADWCGPCKMVGPILDEISDEYKGKLNVYKIDTDKEQELAVAFNVQSIPTILFVPKDGNPQMSQGALPKDAIEDNINDILKVQL